MNVKIRYVGAFLAVMVIFANKSYPIDFWSLADQSSYRCPGGVVATGDSDSQITNPIQIQIFNDSNMFGI